MGRQVSGFLTLLLNSSTSKKKCFRTLMIISKCGVVAVFLRV